MPIKYDRYPANWTTFSSWVRQVRAQGRCECTGQCGLHVASGSTRRCNEVHDRGGIYAHGRIILSAAHLCGCIPPCANPAHVIAACQRCHLRIDRALHAVARKKTIARKQTAGLELQAQVKTA